MVSPHVRYSGAGFFLLLKKHMLALQGRLTKIVQIMRDG
jgi:hypothetical protein